MLLKGEGREERKRKGREGKERKKGKGKGKEKREEKKEGGNVRVITSPQHYYVHYNKS